MRCGAVFLTVGILSAIAACRLETIIFPIFEEPFLLPQPPAALGPFPFQERVVRLDDLGDGVPGDVTIFEPRGASGLRPTLVWLLGVNNRPHFHQSFHEYMASWGYIDIVPATRDIDFTDSQYHRRNIDNALNVYALAAAGALNPQVDGDRIAWGGYSVGGSLAALAAAEQPGAAVLMWAPAPALIWQGVVPAELLPRVTSPSLFLLAEFDNVVGDWPAQMQQQMVNSPQSQIIIAGGVHLFFQQPPSVDDRNPATPIDRLEQMQQALENSRSYLDVQLAR